MPADQQDPPHRDSSGGLKRFSQPKLQGIHDVVPSQTRLAERAKPQSAADTHAPAFIRNKGLNDANKNQQLVSSCSHSHKQIRPGQCLGCHDAANVQVTNNNKAGPGSSCGTSSSGTSSSQGVGEVIVGRDRRKRDKKYQTSSSSNHSLITNAHIQTSCEPDEPVNVEIRLQLAIVNDLSNELEELARLRRIGDFRAAKEFFGRELAEHVDNPYVFVQYADLLLAMHDYKTLQSLQPPRVFGLSIEEETLRRSRKETSTEVYDLGTGTRYFSGQHELRLLSYNWRLIKCLVLIHTEDWVSDGVMVAEIAPWVIKLNEDPGSTELQILVLCIRVCLDAICSLKGKDFAELARPIDHFKDHFPQIPISLSKQERHWDYCDFQTANELVFGYENDQIWTGPAPNFETAHFDFLHQSWGQLHHDETILLACLDQATSIVLGLYADTQSTIETSGRWENLVAPMDKAAELLIQHYPGAVRSRPFIRWLIVSSQRAAELAENLTSADNRRPTKGLTHRLKDDRSGIVLQRLELELPIFVPKGTAVPKWDALECPRRVKESLHLALNLAKEMDDYPTQVICYKLLALRSREPKPLLASLCRLQEAMGDRGGHLRTLLSSYIGCEDRASQRNLLNQLSSFHDSFKMIDIDRRDLTIHWASTMIKRALSNSLGCRCQETLDWTDDVYARHLPKFIQNLASKPDIRSVEAANAPTKDQFSIWQKDREAVFARSPSVSQGKNRPIQLPNLSAEYQDYPRAKEIEPSKPTTQPDATATQQSIQLWVDGNWNQVLTSSDDEDITRQMFLEYEQEGPREKGEGTHERHDSESTEGATGLDVLEYLEEGESSGNFGVGSITGQGCSTEPGEIVAADDDKALLSGNHDTTQGPDPNQNATGAELTQTQTTATDKITQPPSGRVGLTYEYRQPSVGAHVDDTPSEHSRSHDDKRRKAWPEPKTVSVGPVEAQSSNPRTVRWLEDSKRQQQNSRIGNRKPLITSAKSSHLLSEVTAPTTNVS